MRPPEPIHLTLRYLTSAGQHNDIHSQTPRTPTPARRNSNVFVAMRLVARTRTCSTRRYARCSGPCGATRLAESIAFPEHNDDIMTAFTLKSRRPDSRRRSELTLDSRLLEAAFTPSRRPIIYTCEADHLTPRR